MSNNSSSSSLTSDGSWQSDALCWDVFIDQPADYGGARPSFEMFTLFTVIHHHTSTTKTRQTCEIKMVNVYTACRYLESCLRVICQTGFFRNILHDQQLYHSLVCKQRVVTLIVYRSGLRGARSVWSGEGR